MKEDVAMSSSSPIKHDMNLSDQFLKRLHDLRSQCINSQCRLIENFYLHNPDQLSNDMIDIIKELKDERENPAINLAGRMILDLTLKADKGEWSITTNPDFLKSLTPEDHALIEQKINAKAKKFSENDIREVLQDLLVSKFNLFLNIGDKQDKNLPTLLQQYIILFQVHMQFDACLECLEQNNRLQLRDQLDNLNTFMKASTELFSEPRKIGFFSKQTDSPNLPDDFKKMLDEVSESVQLLKEQRELSRIDHRTP